MSTLFVELISILVNASMYFNYDFDFIFFYISTRYDCELVKWNIGRLDKHPNLRPDQNFM